MPDSPPQAAGGTLIGYARCSTATQDLTGQQDALRALGVKDERIYLDRGLTGRNRERPGLGKALAAVRDGDTLVVPKLDRRGSHGAGPPKALIALIGPARELGYGERLGRLFQLVIVRVRPAGGI